MRSLELLESTRNDQELHVELVRMCVAEAGYNPGAIQPITDRALTREGLTFFCIDVTVPPEVCWKARELVGIGEPKCFRCTRRDRWVRGAPTCRASGRFELDCGVADSSGDEDGRD